MTIAGRPWDGRYRVRIFDYFGIGDEPYDSTRRRALAAQEAKLYALEEFQRLIDSDAKARRARP